MLSGPELRTWLRDADERAVEEMLGLRVEAPTTPPGEHLMGHHMIGASALVRALDAIPVRASDRVLDLGAGLGKLLALTHLLTGASVRGIEIQSSLVCRALPLANVIEGDVRDADLGDPTVVFLYCPFSGPVVHAVAERLDRTNATVCAFGIDLPLRRLRARTTDDFWMTIWEPAQSGAQPRI
jgi:hypothetical protein